MAKVAPELELRAFRMSPWWLGVLVLALAAGESIRSTAADLLYRRNTVRDLRESVRLDPGNSLVHQLLGEHIEESGGNPDSEFEEAVRLSPRDSRFLIRLALRQEVEGHSSASEDTLFRALAVDRRFDARWALMNFYFRQGDEAKFWRWARESFEWSYGDRTALFRLCRAMSTDPEKTRAVLPKRHEVLAAYLRYLVYGPDQGAAGPVAVEVAREATEGDVPMLEDYVDLDLRHDFQTAMSVWNLLCQHKLLPFTPLDSDSGAIVTNGHFSVRPTARGFDWRAVSAEGVSVAPMASGGLSFTMSGTQIAEFALLSQAVPMAANVDYHLRYDYRLSAVNTKMSGLHWAVTVDDGPDRKTSTLAELQAGTDWQAADKSFHSNRTQLVTISLFYRRPLGERIWEGTLELRKVLAAR